MRPRRKLFTGGLDVFVFTPTISTTVYNYDVTSAATSAGWDGVKPLYCTITVTGTGRIESTSTGSYALTYSTLPVGSPEINLNVLAGGVLIGAEGVGGAGGAASGVGGNNGGDGGTGGPCISAYAHPIRITNAGSIFGGGGGSGGGGNAGNIAGGGALLVGGGKGQGSDGPATSGGYDFDAGTGRSATGGAGGTGGPGNSGSLGGGGGGFVGGGGAQGANGYSIAGVSNVTYIAAGGAIVGPQI